MHKAGSTRSRWPNLNEPNLRITISFLAVWLHWRCMENLTGGRNKYTQRYSKTRIRHKWNPILLLEDSLEQLEPLGWGVSWKVFREVWCAFLFSVFRSWDLIHHRLKSKGLTLTGTTFSLYNLINLATEKKSRLINMYWLLSHGSVIWKFCIYSSLFFLEYWSCFQQKRHHTHPVYITVTTHKKDINTESKSLKGNHCY